MMINKMKVKNLIDQEEELSSFFYCWIKLESNLFLFWEIAYVWAWLNNMYFALITISFQYLLIFRAQQGMWLALQVFFIFDIVYNIVVQHRTSRGTLTRLIKDSFMEYFKRIFIVDLVGLVPICVSLHGDFFGTWHEETVKVWQAILNDTSNNENALKLINASNDNSFIRLVRAVMIISLTRLLHMPRIFQNH